MARYPGVDENDFITLSLAGSEVAAVFEDSGDCPPSIDEDNGIEGVQIFDRYVSPCGEGLVGEPASCD